MIAVRGLAKSFGALRAVSDLDFDVRRGQVTSIIGPNGAGKSTVFNLIAGTIRPDAGRVELDGRDVTALAPHALAQRGLARSFQISNLFFGLTVLENVRLACQARAPRKGFLARLDRDRALADRARAILAEFAIADLADEPAANLSHGDQRRLEIAVCMASRPRVLLLDEPTQGMSPAETLAVDALIKSLAGRVSVLMIEHDVDLVMNISDHVIVLHQGQKLFEGPPAQVRNSSAVRAAYLGAHHASD
ncbi:MAG: branched-chain amino acid transport system ATP-binding protein [Alphaproteobacteria bacterium]|nr:branched-chain amino acid transport system ATP-binding protein [Alphaproteobacteria bacterium]